MKTSLLKLSLVAAMATFSYAGGDYVPTYDAKPVVAAPTSTITGNIYGGLGLTAISTYGDKYSIFSEKLGQDRVGGIAGIIGYKVNPNFSVEGRVSYASISNDFSKSTNVSIFAKPIYPINGEFSVYGLLGFGYSKIKGTKGHADIASKASLQGGLGVSYKVQNNVDLFVDYTLLLSDVKSKSTMPDGTNKVSHSAITVGALYTF